MDWDQYFFSIAKVVSAKSTCPSRSVGAVIINPDTHAIITTGYNGAPRGTAHCGDACRKRESGKSFEKCKAVHAELNAILAAAMNGVSVMNATMYLTTTPCLFCARTIVNSGIKHVYAMSYYPNPESLDLLVEGGVRLTVMHGIATPSLNINQGDIEVIVDQYGR
jgi:dCMP deaminase